MNHNRHEDKFDLAHFNPKELEILDETQGGRHNLHPTEIRHYGKLEEMLSDPKVEALLHKEYERHAKGGQIGEILRTADDMRKRGRKGDIDVAVIGPNTRRIFNHLMHGGSVNPATGKSEYFNLGGMMKGIGKTVSRGVNSVGHMANKAASGVGNMATKAASGLGNMAMQAVPGAIMGGLEGGPAGALAGGLGSVAMNQMSGGNKGGGQKAPSIPQNLGQMGQQFMNSQMGQNMGNQAKNMYNQANNAYQNSPTGQGMQRAYTRYTGQQAPQSLQQGGQQFMNSQAGQAAQQDMGNAYNQANNQYQGAMNSPMGQSFQNGYNSPMNGQYGQQSSGYNGQQAGYNQQNQQGDNGYSGYNQDENY